MIMRILLLLLLLFEEKKKKKERFDIAKTPRANSFKRWRSMAGGEGRVKKKQGAGSFRQRACVLRIIL